MLVDELLEVVRGVDLRVDRRHLVVAVGAGHDLEFRHSASLVTASWTISRRPPRQARSSHL